MKAIDASQNTFSSLSDLKAAGVTAIGRYYSTATWKVITQREATAIRDAGLSIFVVWEDGNEPDDFDADKGTFSAQHALQFADSIQQDPGSAIYFAVDFDIDEATVRSNAAPYFAAVKNAFRSKGVDFRIGVYGNGLICRLLLDEGLCDLAWLSQSTGHREHSVFYASGRWAIAQGPSGQIGTLGIDPDEVKGDFGCFPVLAGAPVGGVAAAGVAVAAPAALIVGAGAPLPAVSEFAKKIVGIAQGEWEFFGKQTYDLDGHVTHSGHKEGEDVYSQKIGTYWAAGTNTRGIDGSNHDHPWSAAFISWVMKTGGAGDKFRYSTLHSVYIYQAIRDRLSNRDAGFWGYRLNEYKPNVGDLICWARQSGIDYDHQNAGVYAGHSDIVVEVNAQEIFVIGGNVGDSVTKRPFALDAAGFLKESFEGGEVLIAIMEDRISA